VGRSMPPCSRDANGRFRRNLAVGGGRDEGPESALSEPFRSRAAEDRFGSMAAVVAKLMVQPVCPQLRKCRVDPGSYAWFQYPPSHHRFRPIENAQIASPCANAAATKTPGASGANSRTRPKVAGANA